MNMSDMKNMVILKNLPSNLVEEAIIILKENKNIHKYQMQEAKENNEKENSLKNKENKKDSNYIIKEAEMLVKSYTESLERKGPKWKNNMKKLEKRYNNSVKLNFFLLFTTILGLIFIII